MALTKEEILELPLLSYPGPVQIISNKDEWAKAYEKIKEEKVLGFDTESKPTYVKGPLNPPAIMQLATEDCVYIIQFYRLKLLPTMIEILSDPDTLKVGIAIRDDFTFLQKRGKFTPDGLVDLAPMAKKKGYTSSGLRTLCAELMQGRLSKTMRCSNWEKVNLSPSQILYASTDAWISRVLYFKILETQMPEIKL